MNVRLSLIQERSNVGREETSGQGEFFVHQKVFPPKIISEKSNVRQRRVKLPQPGRGLHTGGGHISYGRNIHKMEKIKEEPHRRNICTRVAETYPKDGNECLYSQNRRRTKSPFTAHMEIHKWYFTIKCQNIARIAKLPYLMSELQKMYFKGKQQVRQVGQVGKSGTFGLQGSKFTTMNQSKRQV